MINTIKRELARSIVQLTNVFSTEIIETTARCRDNKIRVDLPDGIYSISGAKDTDEFSAGCINDTHNIIDGVITTETFFGDTTTSQDVFLHTVNIGDAFNREAAMKIINNPKQTNSIIVYVGDCSVESEPKKAGIGADMQIFADYSIGIMFKIKELDMVQLGCLDYDKILINAAINIQNRVDNTTLLRFENVNERFKAGLYYVVDYVYGYQYDMFIDEKMRERLRTFNSQFIIDQEVEKEKISLQNEESK